MPCRSPTSSRKPAAILGLAVICLAGACREVCDEEVRPLPPEVVERPLAAGSVHRYCVDLTADEFIDLEVRQQGVDLEVDVVDPRGKGLRRVDSPNGPLGTEEIRWVAARPGSHRLELRGVVGTGCYVLRTARRQAGERERALDRAAETFQSAENLRRGKEPARPLYDDALGLWQDLGEARQEAITLYRLAKLRARSTERVEPLRRVVEIAGEHGFEPLEIQARLALGKALRRSGQLPEARRQYETARQIARRVGDLTAEATALNDLALLLKAEGHIRHSLTLYADALDIYRELGDHAWVAVTLTNLGAELILVNRPDEARVHLEEALRLHREHRDRSREALVLTHLGWVYARQGDFPRAFELYDEAIELSRETENPRRLAAVLDRRGTAYLDLGQLDDARASFEQAFEIYREIGPPTDAAHESVNLGKVLRARGQVDGAFELVTRALGVFQAHGTRHGEAGALFERARLLRDRGDPEAALADMERLADLVESIRAETGRPELRLAYFESRHLYFEFYIDLLMELHARDGAGGYDARALVGVERARARMLLDLLHASTADLGREPRRPPRIVRLDEIRDEILDADTLLLAYSLGRDRSFLWRVTADALSVHELPPRAVIENGARRLHNLLESGRGPSVRAQVELAVRNLGRDLLGPVATRLDRRRIVVLPDGVLHYIPFAILPSPATQVELVAEHEIVRLPSASVLAALRNDRGDRPPPEGEIAILADPVFHRDDRRFADADGSSGLAAGRLEGYDRLVHTRREADAVLALAPDAETFRAFDFDASRATVLGGALHGYRIVHFATHGLLDEEHPERSGLVLSGFDAEGRPVDELLRLDEIYGLDLAADLVVLSACRTALGREVRGEGMVGLTQGFFDAGARSVLVSLWSVSDQSTAELMEHFYRALWQDGLSPAAALRAAQNAMRLGAHPSPYDWAGFVLVGEWR